MKKILLFLFVTLPMVLQAQRFNFKDYLVLGVDAAEDLTSTYLEPINEGIMYGITGGWNNTARVKQPWQLDVALVANGTFVPNEKLSWTINIAQIDNLEVLARGSENIIRVPTILGSTDSNITFVATINGEEFQFDAPTGIGLFSANWLPTAMLQAGVGLPGNSEFNFRYFPKLNIDDASVGVIGFGLKHEISESIKPLRKLPLAIAFFAAFTRLDANYDFESDGFITGQSQRVDGNMNTGLFELLASTKFPKWNVYGGVGYVTGRSTYALKGVYSIQLQDQMLNFTDPFRVQNDITGIRANIGALVHINRFSVNLDYTFQGYNNFSLGFNYTILKGKVPPAQN